MTFSLSRQLSPTFRKLRDLSIYCGVYSRVALEPLATPHMYVAWPSACQHPKGYTTHCQLGFQVVAAQYALIRKRKVD
jgi:hypothetical protein